jgi:hypothetical protein
MQLCQLGTDSTLENAYDFNVQVHGSCEDSLDVFDVFVVFQISPTMW